MQDLADHPFSPENIAYESGDPSESEAAWLRWASECERLLGHDLDGDGRLEGYSIDEASDHFDRGATAHAYVAMVTSRERYRKPELRTDSVWGSQEWAETYGDDIGESPDY
jgi:hypothetical protein